MSRKHLSLLLILCALLGVSVFAMNGMKRSFQLETTLQPTAYEQGVTESEEAKLIYKNDQYGFEFSYSDKIGQYLVKTRKTIDGAVLLDFNLPTTDPDYLKSNLTQYTDFTVSIIPGVYESSQACSVDKPECVPGFVEKVVARDQQNTYVISLQTQSRPEGRSDKSAFQEVVKSFRLIPR